MRTSFLGIIFTFVAIGGTALGQGTTSVDWSNSNTTLLRDQSGVALSAGGNGNNNGDLIQLGYYDAATSSNPFAGNWVALTGAGPQLTTIGDDRNGSGLADGRFDFTTTWHIGTNNVDVFDSAFDNNPYTTKSQFTITSALPSAGQILSIRFYDTTTVTPTSHYNAVSNTNWTWSAPTDGGTNLNAISLTQANLVWQSVLVFNMTGTEFRTVLAIPEPATIALLSVGLAAIPFLRRRKA